MTARTRWRHEVSDLRLDTIIRVRWVANICDAPDELPEGRWDYVEIVQVA